MTYEAALEGSSSNTDNKPHWRDMARQLLDRVKVIFKAEKKDSTPDLFFQDLEVDDQAKLEKKVQEIRNHLANTSLNDFKTGDVVVSQAALMNFKANPLNELTSTSIEAVRQNYVVLIDSRFPNSHSYFYANLKSAKSILSLRVLSQADCQFIRGFKPTDKASSRAMGKSY